MTSLSVIIPAHNAARTLGETLESVLGQSEPAAEIIVVDDGSTDNTADVAIAYASVRLLRQPNTGPGAALNTGISVAVGSTYTFLDADDIMEDGAIASQLKLLLDMPDVDGAVGFFEEFVCPSESAQSASRFRPRGRQPCWLGGGMALSAPSFHKVGFFDPQLRMGHWIDWMDRAKSAGLRFQLHETLVLRRRLHRGSLSMGSAATNGRGLLPAVRSAIIRRKLPLMPPGVTDS